MRVGPGAAPLVGRADELGVLVGAALSGPGGVTLVAGEAGSGKTRLLDEVAGRAAAAGARVLRGHAVPGGGPFRPLAEALTTAAGPALAQDERVAPFRAVLARLLPAWTAGPADGGAGPHLVDPVLVLGEAVGELLGVIAGSGRAVVVLDDLHWADRDTLAVLEYLAGRLAATEARVLGAMRSDEQPPEGLTPLRRARVATVDLGRLAPSDAAALTRAVLGDEADDAVRDHVLAAADGLPLLVEELAARLADSGAIVRREGRWHASGPLATEVPEAFADAVADRVAALGPGDRDVLRVAALLGRDLPWDLLPPAAGTDAATAAGALRHAVDARLLVATADGGLRWRHALTQDAVLATLTGPERSVLAADAARALDRDDLAGPVLARVAELHARGGDPDRAAALLLRHAREHRAAGARSAALAVLEQATALAGEGHRVPVALERVEVLALAARTDEALAVGGPLLGRADGPALAVSLARACVAAERFAEAQGFLARAADPDDPRVLAVAAHVAAGTGEVTHAVDLARRALVTARGDAACEALEVVGRALRRSDPEGSAAAFRRAAEIAERGGLTDWRVRALSELGVADIFGTGDGEPLRRARELAREAGMIGTTTMLELQLVAVDNGRLGPVAAGAQAERVAERAGRLGLHGPRAQALGFLARGRVFDGRLDEAEALLTEATELAANPVHIASARALARAHDRWLAGDTAAALPAYDEAVDQLRRAEATSPTPGWGERALLRTAVAPDDPGPREELRRSDVLVQALNRGALHLCDAVAAVERGDDPAPDLAAADDVLAHRPFFRHLLRCFLLEHTVLGDPVPVLHEVLAWAAGTEEVRLAEWCRQRLRGLGAPVPRPQRDVVDVPPELRAQGVTGREMEVLRLVDAGLGNPEIAAGLHLSRRTVETHVANLLAKTGAAGRVELRSRLPR